MKIDRLERININDSPQWVLIRGKNDNAPLLLHVQAGPGLPIIPEADTMEKMLHLEEHFLVVYWDQRGCGKSYSKNTDASSINFSRLSDDIISCVKYLLKTYHKQNANISGYSIGASLALMAVAKQHDIFGNLFLVGTDVDIPRANSFAIEFALKKAKELNRVNLIKRIEELQNMPITDAKRFQQRAKILTDFGGITIHRKYNQLVLSSIRNLLYSKSYSLTDVAKTIKGMKFCQNALLPEMDTFNLFNLIASIEAPVHFVHGRHDGVAPHDIAQSFFKQIKAPEKKFTTFENSAHMPHYDEPDKFAELLISECLSKNKQYN